MSVGLIFENNALKTSAMLIGFLIGRFYGIKKDNEAKENGLQLDIEIK